MLFRHSNSSKDLIYLNSRIKVGYVAYIVKEILQLSILLQNPVCSYLSNISMLLS